MTLKQLAIFTSTKNDVVLPAWMLSHLFDLAKVNWPQIADENNWANLGELESTPDIVNAIIDLVDVAR